MIPCLLLRVCNLVSNKPNSVQLDSALDTCSACPIVLNILPRRIASQEYAHAVP